MKSPRNIVFSPHVDDEVIGCFTALERGLITDVVYFHDLTPDRIVEADNSAKMFGFKPWFCHSTFADMVEIPPEVTWKLGTDDTIWCPTMRDSHIQHALVNKEARHLSNVTGCQLVFYTVDMNSFQVPLPEKVRASKKEVLSTLFPSQRKLLEDEKYHLFEGYSEVDHMTSYSFHFDDGRSVYITGYNPPNKIDKPTDSEQDEAYLNRLIVSYYDRVNVSEIIVFNGNKMVQING